MNLHVNLLIEEETRRPGSHLLRTFVLTSAAVGFAGVVLHAAYALLSLENTRRALKGATAVWAQIEPGYKHYQDRSARLATLERFSEELRAFSNAQLKASVRLAALPEAVPQRAQLIELAWDHADTRLEGEPARRYDMILTGLIVGSRADRVVEQFIASLKVIPPPNDFGSVTPGGFKMAPSSRSTSRVEEKSIFEVRSEFAPRRYR